MLNILIILFGNLISKVAKICNLGHGSTWPGHIALKVNKHFVKDLLEKSKLQIIVVAGTNGKTTTSLMIKTILEKNGKRVIHNESGANLLNGIASSLLLKANFLGKVNADYAIFELDENVLPHFLHEIDPHYIVLLNLFRDQLDRYGEVNSIAEKWTKAFRGEYAHTAFILNADDPQIAWIGQGQDQEHTNILYYGLEDTGTSTVIEHAADSTYCPRCNHKLTYSSISYSHLGNWHCLNCELKRPQLETDSSPLYPLKGTYNKYNTIAAVCVAKKIGLSNEQISNALVHFSPAFGRQEKIIYHEQQIQIFLSKNPTGFNESIRTIRELKTTTVLLALNDRIADGKDVSWIWDVDFEMLNDFAQHIIITGDRAYDLGLRIKYSTKSSTIGHLPFSIESDTTTAINKALSLTSSNETLYILSTYTAMLEIRKILSGKKIL